MFHVSLCRNVRSLSNSLYTQVLQSLMYHIIYPLGFFIHQVLRSNILTVLSIHNQLTFLSFGVQFFQPFSFAAANTSSGQYITQTFPNKSLSAYVVSYCLSLYPCVVCSCCTILRDFTKETPTNNTLFSNVSIVYHWYYAGMVCLLLCKETVCKNSPSQFTIVCKDISVWEIQALLHNSFSYFFSKDNVCLRTRHMTSHTR